MSLKATKDYKRTPKGLLTVLHGKHVERSNKRGFPRPSYSLMDLHERFLGDKNFLKLHAAWVKGGYKSANKPSIDRIDCTKPYTLENIQFMTWAENRAKGDKEQVEHYKRTEVIMSDLYGHELKRFCSIKDAVKDTGCHQGLITEVCQGKRNQTGGYHWSYGEQRCVRHKEHPHLLKES